jgi:hypothetical protein
MLKKLLCIFGIHYRPIYHYAGGKRIKWFEFWKDIEESDISLRCRVCGKL